MPKRWYFDEEKVRVLLSSVVRAEYVLRRISEGDHKALMNAEHVSHDLRMLLREMREPLADEEG